MTRFMTAKNQRNASDLIEELKSLKQQKEEAVMIRNNIKSNLTETNS